MNIDFDLSENPRETGSVQPPLTALIDMVFMLLIYFLLTMGFMVDEGIGIKLPGAEYASQTLPRDLVVAISADGALFWESREVSIEELTNHLRLTPDLTTRTRVVIRADRGATVNSVVSVMDLAKSLGAASFCLATEVQP